MSTEREAETPAASIPAQVFLSYANEDREQAVWLRAGLLKAGVAEVWLDRAKIEGGERWKKEIDNGLRDATVLLLLLTKSSADDSRRWIEYERGEARRLLKPIIPLRFEAEATPPESLEHLQYVDFTGDRCAALLELRNAIARHTPRYASPTRLPVEPPPIRDGFVGREDELQKLFELIDAPAVRVETARKSIAIQGMGGQGKTMLAEELVRRIAARYPGGLIIERRGQAPEPARAVLQKWATLVLGQMPSREYQPADVRSLLGGYGELLVLIDDVSESDFGETKQLLDALPPDATRLLTTRSLNVRSELGCVVYRLYGLNDEDACELVRDRLRAMSGSPDAPVDSLALDEATRRLVELVQGHPLALELAVARCDSPKGLPKVVKRLAASLSKGLEGLDVNLADAPASDNSLAVSLNISLEHLREHDRAKGTNWAERFAALGVFPDGGRMDAEMIAAVWGDAEGGDDEITDDALSGLYRRAMIRQEPEEELYLIHPLLRALARGLLREEPERLAATQLRYRDFLTRTAERGFREPEEQWSRMQLYAPHLRYTAAELWDEWTRVLGDLDALAQAEEPAACATLADPSARDAALRAIRFVQAVMGYVLRRPALGEDGGRLLKLGLACVRAAGSEELLDTFVRALGVWYARGNPAAAERYFEQALLRAEQTGDRAEQGKVLSDYGELQRNRSKLDHAVGLLDRALAIHQELGDERMQAATHKSLGEAYWRLCDFDAATRHYRRAVEIYQSLKDISGEADLHNKIGSVEFNRGNYKGAVCEFRKARRMHRKVGNRSMEGEDLNDMGISYNYLGRPKRALLFLEKAIEIHGQLGNRRLEAIAISNRAGAFYALGRQDPCAYESAVREARNAGAVAREVECRFTEVWAMNWEALAQQELGRPELALPLLERAVALLDETGGPRERVATWATLGYLLGRHLGQRERGAALLSRALELMRVNRFERAFGGRTRADLEAMLQEISR